MSICPFWRDKSKNVEEYCDPAPVSSSTFSIIGRTNDRPQAFSITPSGGVLFTNQVYSDVYFAPSVDGEVAEICTSFSYDDMMFASFPGSVFAGVDARSARLALQQFDVDTCILTGMGDEVRWVISDFVTPDTVGFEGPAAADNVNGTILYRYMSSDVGGINTAGCIRTIDGATWQDVTVAVGVEYESYSGPILNEDTDIGGFLYLAKLDSTGKWTIFTSSKDAGTWTNRGDELTSISGHAIERGSYRMFHNDVVVFDYYDTVDFGERIAVTTSYGTVFSHDMVFPTAPEWGGGPYDVWISGAMCYDPVSSTLFVVFYGDKTDPLGGTIQDNQLFKSDDMGLTWTVVSDLINPDWHWNTCWKDWLNYEESTYGNMSMRIHDGYLCLLDQAHYIENEGDTSATVKPVFIRFKLEDIV